MRRPSHEQLQATAGRRIRDVIAQDLRLLFVGINPGLYSGAVGHHFARPGNRFWKAVHGAGLTPRILSPFEDRDLLQFGIGVTNIVARTTASAAELSTAELRRGAAILERKIARYRPHAIAFLGIGAYRSAFGRPRATLGRQPEPIAGAPIWVLPNPSGLNAAYQLPALVDLFRSIDGRG